MLDSKSSSLSLTAGHGIDTKRHNNEDILDYITYVEVVGCV